MTGARSPVGSGVGAAGPVDTWAPPGGDGPSAGPWPYPGDATQIATHAGIAPGPGGKGLRGLVVQNLRAFFKMGVAR